MWTKDKIQHLWRDPLGHGRCLRKAFSGVRAGFLETWTQQRILLSGTFSWWLICSIWPPYSLQLHGPTGNVRQNRAQAAAFYLSGRLESIITQRHLSVILLSEDVCVAVLLKEGAKHLSPQEKICLAVEQEFLGQNENSLREESGFTRCSNPKSLSHHRTSSFVPGDCGISLSFAKCPFWNIGNIKGIFLRVET